PVIAFADAGGGELKGSARSIPGLHIRDALALVAARHPGLLGRFGGHAAAAGMALAAADLDAFAAAFDGVVRELLTAEDLELVLAHDGELAAGELSLANARLLRDAGPWGQQFPEPVFVGEFLVVEARAVGEVHLKLRLAPAAGAEPLDAIAFNALEVGQQPQLADRIRILYRLDVNCFRGVERLQLVVDQLC